MSTHIRPCIVCRENSYCCNDTHALGCGGDGCFGREEEAIEFCSEACFHELERRMAAAWKNYLEVLKGDGW